LPDVTSSTSIAGEPLEFQVTGHVGAANLTGLVYMGDWRHSGGILNAQTVKDVSMKPVKARRMSGVPTPTRLEVRTRSLGQLDENQNISDIGCDGSACRQ